MKKTQVIDLLTNIKKTIIVFLSIMLFVALSIGCFVGIKWSGGSISNAIDDGLEEANYHDAEVVFAYQFDDDDLKEIAKVEGVDEIEGSRYIFGEFTFNENDYEAKIMQINERIDLPLYVDGTLPTNNNECAIDVSAAERFGVNIGDKLVFTNNSDNTARLLTKIVNYVDGQDIQKLLDMDATYYNDYLVTDTLTVTAICTNTANLNADTGCYGVASTNMQNVDCLLYVDESAFDKEALEGYTDVLIRSDALRGLSTYSDEYRELAEELQERVKPVVNKIAKEKCELIHSNADLLSINADTLLKESKQKIDDGQAQVDSAEEKLAKAEKLLSVARTVLAQIDKIDEEQVVSIYRSANNAAEQLIDKASDNEELVETYEDLKDRGIIGNLRLLFTILGYEKGVETIDTIDNNLKTMADDPETAEKIRELAEQIELVREEYNNEYGNLDGVELLTKLKEDAWSEYYSYNYQYNNAVQQVEDAKLELADANEMYSFGIEYLNDLNESKEEIPDYEGNILLRKYNASVYVSVTINHILEKLCYSMASLFVLVGLLVCYSSITRIVNDQIKIIGTKKALGLLQNEIVISYLAYTGIAVVLGCILGILLGVFLVETIAIQTFAKIFTVHGFTYYVDWANFALMCTIEIVLLLLVTYFSCRSTFKKSAIKLLAGQEPPLAKQRFYEKNKVWNKFSLLTKTIINNCVNDKRRVIGTLIGIAGSCALIVTSFTMCDNINDSFVEQYNNLYHFDEFICFEGDQDTSDELDALLDKYEVRHAEVMKTRIGVKLPDGDYVYAYVFITDDLNNYRDLITLKEDGKATDNYTGVWMSNSYDAYYDPKGEPVDLITTNGNEALVDMTGYFDTYITQYNILMGKEEFESYFNEEYVPNAYMINSEDVNMKVLMKDLVNVDGFIKVLDYKADTQGSFKTFSSVSGMIVMIYSFLAVVMAFLVLLNLLTMFVDEKQKELTVLMINGFYLKDARKYIYSDTILLTFIGMILGLILGTITGNASVASFKTPATVFLEKIDLKACLIGAAGSIVLTFIVSCISLSKIKKFKLTDINKA